MTTLADKVTLARLAIAPLAVASYIFLPMQGHMALFVCAILCGIAELTDWLDGKIARARNEVSDFGKLADPFCDVFYRIAVLSVAVLPAGLVGLPIDGPSNMLWMSPSYLVESSAGPPWGSGIMPFFPILIMVLREIIAGALRAICASKGIVLAARMSGKVKAWFQGFTLISALGVAAFWGYEHADLVRLYAAVLAWSCAAFSLGSLCEYLWINRFTLQQLSPTDKNGKRL